MSTLGEGSGRGASNKGTEELEDTLVSEATAHDAETTGVDGSKESEERQHDELMPEQQEDDEKLQADQEAAPTAVETISPLPAKKKSKAKAKVSTKKMKKEADGASVPPEEEAATPDSDEAVEFEATTKKGKKRGAYSKGSGGKKKKVSIKPSESHHAREVVEDDEEIQPSIDREDTEEGDAGGDAGKIFCICKTLYGESFFE
jgi:hypothetical protein